MAGYLRLYGSAVTPPPGGALVLFPTATGVTVIDGFDRPEDATATWATSVTRKVQLNQITGFCLHTDTPADLATVDETRTSPGVMQRLLPITTVVPSYSGARVGTYYDAIIPLRTDNATGAVYLWIDITCDGTETVAIGNVTITLDYHGVVPTWPALPLQMGFSNWGMILGYEGTWGPYEWLANYPLQMLIDHRQSAMGGMMYAWDGTDTTDWAAHNLAFLNSFMLTSVFPFNTWDYGAYSRTPYFTALGNAVSTMAAHGCGTGAWTYNIDEPSAGDLTQYAAEFTAQKAAYPSIRTMVTKHLAAAGAYDIDILAPVAEYLGVNGLDGPAAYAAAGKTLWMYVSCMSHGCGENRAYGFDDIEGETVYSASGAPDLVIDRTAAEAFGLYLLGYKHGVESLLYFNSIEGWGLWSRTAGSGPIDPWLDPYNFGGNGDGTLLYPGGAQPGNPMGKTLRPYPSIRLKLLREASYLVDALKADSSQTWAKAQVDALVTDSLTWDRTMANIVTLRNAVLNRK